MCFSPEASFTAAAALGAAGAATLLRLRSPRAWLIGATPLLFALHQAVEGVVWLQLRGRMDPAAGHAAAWLFMLYGQGVLPLLIPLGVWLVEPAGRRRAALAGATVIGALLCAYVVHALLRAPSTAVVEGRCVTYRNPLTNHPWVAFLYAVPACGGPMLSSRPGLRRFGVLSLLAMAAVLLVKAYALTSVWCFCAALLSALIYGQARAGALEGEPARAPPPRSWRPWRA